MTHTPSELISEARRLVANLQSSIEQISVIEPRLLQNPQLANKIETVTASLAEASRRLAQPALRIAMIGTTSAGKSTLVNALIGRQVAPIDADEMSAGILHLVHAERTRLVINHAENACWTAVDEYDCVDVDIYTHLKEKVFKPYHAERQRRNVPIPQIRIEGPLLPMNWPDLFALPPKSGLEIYDLPGLNSVQDSENLKVIQSQLKSCFSLVLLDYSHTDRKSRETLLNEIKEVVDALGGTTDTLLFAVNRVDRRTEQDEPLSERLVRLSQEIQQKLNLPAIPELIPVKALPLFYGQVAWGTSAPFEGMEPTTSFEHQLTYFSGFRKDCKQIIPESSDEYDYEDWFYQRRKVNQLATEDLREWVQWTWQWSEGEILLGKLKERIEEKFAEVIIAPVLMTPLSEVTALQEMLATYCETQRVESTDQLKQKQAELEQNFADIRDTVEKKGDNFLQKIKELNHVIAGDTSDVIVEEDNAIVRKLYSEIDSDCIQKLKRTVSSTKKNLIKNIIKPIEDYYCVRLSFYDFEECFSFLPAEEKKKLCRCADEYRLEVMKDTNAVQNGVSLKAKLSDESGVSEIEMKEKKALCLYRAIRNALTVRANYLLQTQTPELERLLSQILQDEVAELKRIFDEKLSDHAAILTALVMDQHSHARDICLPEDLFVFDDAPESQQHQQRDRTGTLYYEEGSCFKSKKSEGIYENVQYKLLRLPSLQEMVDQWKTGINQAEDKLLLHFGAWIDEIVNRQMEITKSAIENAQSYLVMIMEDRLNQSQEEYQERLSRINDLDSIISNMAKDGLNLKDLQISEHKIK